MTRWGSYLFKYADFWRWCASILVSTPPYLTSSCCTVSPKQRRSTTTTQETLLASTLLRQQPAALVPSAGFSRYVKQLRDFPGCQWVSLPLRANICFIHPPQACTEMVMPMCTDGVQDMFEPEEWSFQAFSDECNSFLGVRPRADWAGTVYGGKKIGSHSNIIFRYETISKYCSVWLGLLGEEATFTTGKLKLIRLFRPYIAQPFIPLGNNLAVVGTLLLMR